MISNWELSEMMNAAEEGLRLRTKIHKMKKSLNVSKYEIPEHLKPKNK